VSTEGSQQDPSDLVRHFHAAGRTSGLVVLQGLHALRHALRFGAQVDVVVTADPQELERLARAYAPELISELQQRVVVVAQEVFKQLGPYVPHTGVVSIAHVVQADAVGLWAAENGAAPLILLEDPRNLGNLGAVIRVAAAAQAAGVLSTGAADPWDPVAVRGSAGLHFALPVGHLQELPPTDRPLLAFAPGGEVLRPERIPARAVLAFGSERAGLSSELLDRADECLSLPMRDGVSSLNLATSVAAVLYSLRLNGP